jgi:hypothetical protein
MAIPLTILSRLRSGREVAAEISSNEIEMRAYIVVIPQAPKPWDCPEAWQCVQGSEPVLRDPSWITGYEIRYLQHHIKYTNTDWGWDYDLVLDDDTTRVNRIFVRREDEIEDALSRWLTDMTTLNHPTSFDSALVTSPLDSYLNRAEERPHLWL